LRIGNFRNATKLPNAPSTDIGDSIRLCEANRGVISSMDQFKYDAAS
jgi:hypothetical protein